MIRLFPNRKELSIWLHGDSAQASPENYVLVTASNSKGSESQIIHMGNSQIVNAGKFVLAPRERMKSKKEEFTSAVYRVYVLLGYGFLALLMSFSVLSFGGVVKARVVLTESMEPLISPGDVVITTPISRKEPQVGDIVTYVAKRFDGSPVGTFTHRIIDGNKDSGFIVKGDNNPAPDVQKPKFEDIAGTVIYIVPFIGTLMTPRSLAILIPTLFGIWLVIDALRKRE